MAEGVDRGMIAGVDPATHRGTSPVAHAYRAFAEREAYGADQGFLVSVDGRPRAYADPHGRSLAPLAAARSRR